MDISNKCNLGCRMCLHSLESWKKSRKYDMEWWLFLKIAREIFPKTSELFLNTEKGLGV